MAYHDVKTPYCTIFTNGSWPKEVPSRLAFWSVEGQLERQYCGDNGRNVRVGNQVLQEWNTIFPSSLMTRSVMGGSRGGQGVGGLDPLKNHKNIGFLSNTGSDPLKIHKATKPAFNVGPSSARQQITI